MRTLSGRDRVCQDNLRTNGTIIVDYIMPRLAKDSHRKAATVRFFRPEQGYAHDVLVLLAVSQYIRNLGAYCELHIQLIAQILHLVYLLQG